MEEIATVIEPESYLKIIRNDDADNHILACAVDAKADFLITGDKRHLLPLNRYKGIRIITPKECLDILFKR